MATVREKLVIEADLRDLVTQLDRAEREIDELGREANQSADQMSRAFSKSERSADKLGSTVKRVAAGIFAGVALKRTIDFGAAVVGLASDADEAASAFQTTFGPAARRMGEWVEQSANQMGLARHELQQLTAVTGAVLQGMGATTDQAADMAQEMATLAGDVASFMNVTGGAAPVLAALRSALGGEREALKTYGIAISEAEVQTRALANTGKETAAELTRMEKAVATIQIAQEKAAIASGDLERTSGSLANQVRALQAAWKDAQVEIGRELLPAVVALIPTLRDELLPAVTDAGIAFAQFAESVLPAVSFAAQRTADVLEFLSLTVETFRAEGPSFALANELRRGLGEAMDPVDRLATAFIALERLGEELDPDDVRQFMRAVGAGADETAAALFRAQRALEAHPGLVDDAEAAQSRLTQAMADAGLITDSWVRKLEEAGPAADETAAATGDLAAEADDAADSTEELAAEIKTLHDRLIEARDAQRSLADELRKAADPVFRAADAMSDLSDVLEDVDEDGERTADEQLRLAEALLETQSALDALTPQALRDALDSIATALGITTDEVRELLTELGILDGRTVETVVEITVDDSELGAVEQRLRDLAGRQFTGGSTGGRRRGSTSVRPDEEGAKFPAFQTGGFTTRGGFALLHPGEAIIPAQRLSGDVGERIVAAVREAAERIAERSTVTSSPASIEQLIVNAGAQTGPEGTAAEALLAAVSELIQ